MAITTQNQKDSLRQTLSGAHITSRPWSVEQAFKYCEQLTRSHYENFPVGSILVPRSLRKHFYSIYAFARTADDFADEGFAVGISEGERIKLLADWGAMLRQSFLGEASHPIFIALAETRAQFDLPIALFEDLLSAFTQDVTIRRYQSFVQLLDYCRRSANPVGRLILMLCGHKDEQMYRWSDHICTALQLTNHWQDVAIDLGKGRVYLPAEDLERFGVSYEDLGRQRAGEGFRELMRFEVGRARELFMLGKPLCLSVGGRLGLELRAICLGGLRILERIEQNGYDVMARRPQITLADKLRIGLLAMRRGPLRLY